MLLPERVGDFGNEETRVSMSSNAMFSTRNGKRCTRGSLKRSPDADTSESLVESLVVDGDTVEGDSEGALECLDDAGDRTVECIEAEFLLRPP